MMPLIPTMLAALAITVPAPAKAPEGAQSFRADYSVLYLGVPIARSSFTSTFHEGKFSVAGSLASAGLARIFDDTTGTVRASGQVSETETRAEGYRLEYTSGDKSQLTEIRFAGGDVAETMNDPPLKKRGADWVPLRDRDLRAVVDPLSATLVRADNLDQVCGRTIRGYDGEMRADLELTPHETGSMSVRGFEGRTVTCRVRFVPVSGYRETREAIDYLSNRSRITITFAPLGTTGVYAPIQATVGTRIGPVTVQAQSFEQQN